MQDSSAGNGAGYEQELRSNAEGGVKGGKAAKKKVGSTINKKANEGGKQVLHTNKQALHTNMAVESWCRARAVLLVASTFGCLVGSMEVFCKQVPSVPVAAFSSRNLQRQHSVQFYGPA